MIISGLQLKQDPKDPSKMWLELNTDDPNTPTQQYTLTAAQFAQFQNAGLTPQNEFNNPLYYNKGALTSDALTQIQAASTPPPFDPTGKVVGQIADKQFYTQLQNVQNILKTVSTLPTTGGTNLQTNPTLDQQLIAGSAGGSANPFTPGTPQNQALQTSIAQGNTATGFAPTSPQTYTVGENTFASPPTPTNTTNPNDLPITGNPTGQSVNQVQGQPVGTTGTNQVIPSSPSIPTPPPAPTPPPTPAPVLATNQPVATPGAGAGAAGPPIATPPAPTTPPPTPLTTGTGNPQYDALLAQMQTYLDTLQKNGQVINPNITLTPDKIAEFTNQAAQQIHPYYATQLKAATDTFLSNQGYNVNQYQNQIKNAQTQYGRSLDTEAQSAADRGFAQSGVRQKEEGQLAYDTQNSLDNARAALSQAGQNQAANFAQTYGGQATPNAPLIGASPRVLPGQYNFGQGSNQGLYQLDPNIYQQLIGSEQNSEKQATDTLSSQLQTNYQQQQANNQLRTLTG